MVASVAVRVPTALCLLVLLLALGGARVCAADSAAYDGLGALDLSRPELSDVRAALERGKQAEAAAALRRALRVRAEPAWPNRAVPPPAPSAERHPWGEAIRHGDISQIVPTAPRLKEQFHWQSLGQDRVLDELFYRFEPARWLAVAYRETGNPLYAEDYVRLVSGFVQADTDTNSPAWDRRTAGVRLRCWLETFGTFLDSDAVTPEFTAQFIEYLQRHGRILAQDSTRFQPGTSQVHAVAGLALLAILLPELEESSAWLELAWARLADQVQRGVNDDGLFPEISPTHQVEAMEAVHAVVQLAVRSDAPLPTGLLDSMRPLYMACLKLAKPNGKIDPLNDSGPELDICRRVLEPGARMFPGSSDEFQYVCDVIQHGSSRRPRPSYTSVFLPASGLAVMRNGWGRDAFYALFCATPYGPTHHRDYLQVTLHAQGHSYLIDPVLPSGAPGDATPTGPAAEHSTLRIDGKAPGETMPVWLEWTTLPLLDIASASHAGYPGLVHRRTAVYIKPGFLAVHDEVEGRGTHTYDQVFRAGPFAVEKGPGAFAACLAHEQGGLALFPVRPRPELQLIQDSAVIDLAGREGPWLAYRLAGEPPVSFDTVLIPYVEDRIGEVRLFPLEARGGEDFSPADVLAFHLDRGRSSDLFVMRHRGTEAVVCGAARLVGRGAVLRWEGDLRTLVEFQTVDATRVDERDRLVLAADAPASVHWSLRGERVWVSSDDARHVRVYAPGARSVSWNGSPVPFQAEDDYIVGRR